MATMTVLTAARINMPKVKRRLSRSGYVTSTATGRLQMSRHGRPDIVEITVADPADLSEDVINSAKHLLGLPPRYGICCAFNGSAGATEAWTMIVDIAKAVAAEVPLAVLNDTAGTNYLVHPSRGLIGPEEYETVRRSPGTADILRQLFGGR